MLTPLSRRSKSVRRRPLTVTNSQPTAPIKVADVTVAGSVATVEFDQVVALAGTPAYTTSVAGATAVSAEQTSPTTIEVTFSASVAAATALLIPYEEPAVRNASGGFVSTSTFPI